MKTLNVLPCVVAALLMPAVGTGQTTPTEKTLVEGNAFVIHAEPWQTTTSAPIRLTFNEENYKHLNVWLPSKDTGAVSRFGFSVSRPRQDRHPRYPSTPWLYT
jgi:hypothetical protein